MTGHKHDKHGNHGKDHAPHGKSKSKGVHRDWRLWTVVVLILVGMAVYVLTFDESLSPFRSGGADQETPAAE